MSQPSPLANFCGLVAPVDRMDVDTDTIIPKQYMKSIRRYGFGQYLFDELRYLNPGILGCDNASRRINPAFVLNLPRYEGASILLARSNFGCGSSREHAVWAIAEYGFRVLIAPSFGEIFFDNCIKNGLLPVVLSEREIDCLFEEVVSTPGYSINVDLPGQTLRTPSAKQLRFALHPSFKKALLSGQDAVNETLAHRQEIEQFEAQRFAAMPWLRLDR